MISSEFDEMIEACVAGDVNTVIRLIPHVDVTAIKCAPLRTASLYNNTSCVLALLPHSDASVLENQVLRGAVAKRNSEIFDAVISLCDPTYSGHIFYSAGVLLCAEGWWEKLGDIEDKMTQNDWKAVLEYMTNYVIKQPDISRFIHHWGQEEIDETVDACIKNKNNFVIQLIEVCSSKKYPGVLKYCIERNDTTNALKILNKMLDLKMRPNEDLADNILTAATRTSDINLVKAVLPYAKDDDIVNNFALADLILNAGGILKVFEGALKNKGCSIVFKFLTQHGTNQQKLLLLKEMQEKSIALDLAAVEVAFEDAAIYLNMPILNMLEPLLKNKEKSAVMDYVVQHDDLDVYNLFKNWGFRPTEESIDWSAQNKNREMVRAQMNDIQINGKATTAQLIHSISQEGWLEELETALKNASTDLNSQMYDGLEGRASSKPGETWFSQTVVNKQYEALDKIVWHVKQTSTNHSAMKKSNWMVYLCYHFPEDERCLNIISQAFSQKDCGNIMLKIHDLCCSAPSYNGFNAVKHFIPYADEDACTKLFNGSVDAPKKIQKQIIVEAGKHVNSKNMDPELKNWFEKEEAKIMRGKLQKNLPNLSRSSKKKM